MTRTTGVVVGVAILVVRSALAACEDPLAIPAARAAIDAACPCDAPGQTHADYVHCARAHMPAGIPPECASAAKRCYSRSTCGKPGAVACCRTRRTARRAVASAATRPAVHRRRAEAPVSGRSRAAATRAARTAARPRRRPRRPRPPPRSSRTFRARAGAAIRRATARATPASSVAGSPTPTGTCAHASRSDRRRAIRAASPTAAASRAPAASVAVGSNSTIPGRSDS